MDFIPQFAEELDRETERSRRALLNLPPNMRAWKPHERSMELGNLADLVATIPTWFALILNQDELELAENYLSPKTGPIPQISADFIAALDRSASDAKAALTAAQDARLQASWHLLAAGKVVAETTRRIMLRDSMNHWVHHRGQMTVYLRLIGADVPATYGPSADDKRFD